MSVHTRWLVMDKSDDLIFFHEQKLFSKERFEEEKTLLEWQDLPFFQDHKLVRARILPQHIKIEGRGGIDLDKEHRTYFVYNPETSDLRMKVIPLTPKSGSIYIANKLLNLNLSERAVVDYVQYFGLIVEGDEGPFYFLAHEDEIPWAPNVTGDEKLEMMGRFSTVTQRDSNGNFRIGVQKNDSFLGTSFELTIPCIYAEHAFETQLHVASTGYIRMEGDRGIAKAAFPAQASDLPFYTVEPTGELQRWLNWQRLKTAAVVFALVVPISAGLVVFGLAGMFGSLSVVFDVVIGSMSPSISSWFNLLVARDWLFWLFLIGAATNLVFGVFSVLFLRVAEYVATKRPVAVFDAMITGVETSIKQKYRKPGPFFWAIVRMLVIGLISLLFSWVVIFASFQNLYNDVFDGVSSSLSLRTAFGATLTELVNWLTRGEAPSVITTPIRDFFGYEGSLTGFGKALRTVAGLSVPFIIGEQVRRLFRYRDKSD